MERAIKKHGVGKPSLTKEGGTSPVLQVRLAASDLNTLRERAVELQTSMSVLVRQTIEADNDQWRLKRLIERGLANNLDVPWEV